MSSGNSLLFAEALGSAPPGLLCSTERTAAPHNALANTDPGRVKTRTFQSTHER